MTTTVQKRLTKRQHLTKEEIGARIKSVREEHGLSREDLALSTNMSVNTLGKYERGELSVRADLLCALSSELDTPVDVLIFGELVTDVMCADLLKYIRMLDYRQQKELSTAVKSIYRLPDIDDNANM